MKFSRKNYGHDIVTHAEVEVAQFCIEIRLAPIIGICQEYLGQGPNVMENASLITPRQSLKHSSNPSPNKQNKLASYCTGIKTP
jgi:hypothetical protein